MLWVLFRIVVSGWRGLEMADDTVFGLMSRPGMTQQYNSNSLATTQKLLLDLYTSKTRSQHILCLLLPTIAVYRLVIRFYCYVYALDARSLVCGCRANVLVEILFWKLSINSRNFIHLIQYSSKRINHFVQWKLVVMQHFIEWTKGKPFAICSLCCYYIPSYNCNNSFNCNFTRQSYVYWF